MDTLTRSASLRELAAAWRKAGESVALIPTRGTLHKGHMSLVAEAQERAAHVIVSVFVDPPRLEGHTLEADRELLAKVGADVLFVPPVQEIFAMGRELAAVVDIPELAHVLEGAGRPGHLSALMTVHVKLLNIVRPDIALFGERDFQQLVMVRRLVDAWKDGDVGLLDQLLNQDKRSDPTTHDVLFSKRNSKWMPEIERFAHESGNYLIIVGAGHLVGDDGVVAQLKRAGYSVQQL